MLSPTATTTARIANIIKNPSTLPIRAPEVVMAVDTGVAAAEIEVEEDTAKGVVLAALPTESVTIDSVSAASDAVVVVTSGTLVVVDVAVATFPVQCAVFVTDPDPVLVPLSLLPSPSPAVV